jgi:predicted ATPase/class 3 adenylate cyclase
VARVELPAGTVTFLFTDVEGSTRLLHELGAEAYAAALAEHRRVVREACARHGGVEVDTQGDAFFVAFPTAPGALAAAAAMTTALAAGPIHVRMGLHTGTPLVTEEGYVGADVHRAARIAAAGHGGQVLVSAASAALLDDGDLRDLGEHRFKDLAAAERVYQLGDGEFPALRSLYRTNLPVPATPFLGRERELAEVVTLLTRDDVGLVTLTGPGGTGKTRLALQAAANVADGYPDGVWWVPLAPLRDPTLVLPAVAQVLDVKEQAGTPLGDTVSAAVAGRQSLLLLDNAEHLLPHIAFDVAALRGVEGPTLLVTTRERLQVQGEHTWPVPSLEREDGVALFTTSAQALQPSFVPSTSVTELCERLDNLPLALELAAARTVVFSPDQLLERLGKRLDLLKGSRDADPRQSTLRATIEWSYDLLPADERRLFSALSVFAGGCTYEAAEVVCDAGPDTLQSLLDKSLLRRRDTESGPRYWMLETLREFADDVLATDVRDQIRRAHAEHFVGYVVGRSKGRLGISDNEGLRALTAEAGNIRAALDFAAEFDDAQLFAVAAGQLWSWWLVTGWGPDGLRRTSEALEREADLPEHARVALLVAASELTRLTGDLNRGLALKRQLLEVAGDDDEIALAVLADMADIEMVRGHLDRADELARQSLARGGGARAKASLAEIALLRGDYSRAASLNREAATEFVGVHDVNHALSLESLGEAERLLGHRAAARANFETALTSLAEFGDRSLVAECIEGLAALAADEGDDARARELFGVVAALRVDSTMPPARPTRGRVVDALEDVTLDEALKRALSS